MAWRISDEQWATLAQAREMRPAPIGQGQGTLLFLSGLATFGGILMMAASGKNALFLTCVSAALTAAQAIALGSELRGWRRQFNARPSTKGREIAQIEGAADAPQLRYQSIRARPDWEWLTFLPGIRADVIIEPKQAPIGDPAFDAVLGLKGTDLDRALLGPAMRVDAPQWHVDAGFVVNRGQAKVNLGSAGYNWRDELDEISAAYGAYVDRLYGAPEDGLSHLARDLTHPFDAARALAMLETEWPDEAEAVRVALADHPIGPALARVARTGEGLGDPALDWPTRSAIGRGVLGVWGVASQALASWLETQTPTDDASAMALVDLCEAATALLNRETLSDTTATAYAHLITRGGPACLAWMQARARYGEAARAALALMSGRLQREQTGLLSLEDDAQAGALSAVRAGELAVTSEAPDAG